MSFASLADLQARFGAQELLLLADRDNDREVDPDVIAAVLQDSDAEIVALLGQTIDPANVPLNLVRLACDIARYRLYGANPPDDVRLRYVDATKFLRLVAAGEATLDGGSAAPTAAAAPPKPAATTAAPRVFHR